MSESEGAAGAGRERPVNAGNEPVVPETDVAEDLREGQRLHPMTLLQRLIVSLPGLLLLVIPLFGQRDLRASVYVIALILYGFVAIPLMVLHYMRFRYRITSRELHIDSGVLNRRHRSIPIERIQNIEIQRPLLARITGTARVRVETGGSAGAEGVLDLVSLEMAHRLRDTIRSYQRALLAPAAPLQDPATREPGDEPLQGTRERAGGAEAEQLYAMRLGRVLLSGAFRFSLVYIVIMFSGLQYLNIEVAEIIEWFERGRYRAVSEFAASSPVVAVLVTLATAAVFAWITGILVNLNRLYRFRLDLSNEKLHKEQGLITLQESTIPKKRMQTFILRTNPLMRRFGWWALDVQTLGLEAARRGRSVVVPFGQLSEVQSIVAALESAVLPATFRRVSTLTIRRRFLRYSMVLVVLAMTLGWVWPAMRWSMLGLPLLLFWSYAQFRNHGYAETDDHVFVRSGVLRHQIWIIPRRKHQVFFMSASFFQRRLGLETVYVDTAGAPPFGGPRVVDLPHLEACRSFEQLHTAFRALRNRERQSSLSRRSPGTSTLPTF